MVWFVVLEWERLEGFGSSDCATLGDMIDFYDLNARHEAAFLWIAFFVIATFVESSDFRSSALDLLKTFSEGIILLVLTGLLLFVIVLTILAVIFGKLTGFWENIPVITAMTWFFTAGFPSLASLSNRGLIDAKIRAGIALPAFIAAFFNVAILPFWLEALIFPILVILIGVTIMHSSRPSAGVAKFCLSVYAIVLIFIAAKEILAYPETWKSLVQGILFPIWLTLGSLPYLTLLTVAERYRFDSGVKSRIVSEADYGPDWPLTVKSAKLCCRQSAVWVEVNKKRYGVNGTAKVVLHNNGHKCFDLGEIRRDDPKFDWEKISANQLIQDGLALEKDE